MRSSVSILTAIAISLSSTFSAIANPKQLNLTISTKQNQSYSSLIKNAEAVAKDSIQKSFQSDQGVTDIAVYVLGERNGQKVPLILVAVARSSWQKNPQIQSWIKYFSGTELLLGFVEPTQKPTPVAESKPTTPSVTPNITSNYPTENEPNFYK